MKPVQLLSLIALCVALWCPAGSRAQTPPPAGTNAFVAERVLVIVETSTAMVKRAENVQKALGSVISSGLNSNLTAGSTIGLWTFNEKLSTGQLPLQLWTPVTRQHVALALVQFLQQQKNEKVSRPATAWEAMTNVVAQSQHITVLLFTSGKDPVVGTPFDAAITESFIQNADRQRKQNMPFLTILRAAKGQFVSYSVNMPPWPLEVPEYPEGLKPVSAPPPPPPVVEIKPAPPVVKRPDPAILSPTNAIYLTETAPPVEAPIAPLPQPEPAHAVVAKPVLPPVPPANVSAAVTPAETKSVPVAVSEPAPNKFPIVTILIAGIALLLGVMVVFIALLRWSRRSTGASLITRSMNKSDR
jgi:hypothetical protein